VLLADDRLLRRCAAMADDGRAARP